MFPRLLDRFLPVLSSDWHSFERRRIRPIVCHFRASISNTASWRSVELVLLISHWFDVNVNTGVKTRAGLEGTNNDAVQSGYNGLSQTSIGDSTLGGFLWKARISRLDVIGRGRFETCAAFLGPGVCLGQVSLEGGTGPGKTRERNPEGSHRNI